MDRKPIASTFVIWGLDPKTRKRVQEALGAKISQPSASRDAVLVDVAGAKASIPENRSKLIKLAGKRAIVESVLEDADGARLIPTGKLHVRFRKPPDAEVLRAFGGRHRVEFEKQNRWQGLQAQFAANPGDTRTLTGIVEEIVADPEVASAWPEVLAPFRREE